MKNWVILDSLKNLGLNSPATIPVAARATVLMPNKSTEYRSFRRPDMNPASSPVPQPKNTAMKITNNELRSGLVFDIFMKSRIVTCRKNITIRTRYICILFTLLYTALLPVLRDLVTASLSHIYKACLLPCRLFLFLQ